MQYVTSIAGKDFEGIFLKAINDAKKQNEEKQKMYVSLGTLAGLMLTVIFI